MQQQQSNDLDSKNVVVEDFEEEEEVLPSPEDVHGVEREQQEENLLIEKEPPHDSIEMFTSDNKMIKSILAKQDKEYREAEAKRISLEFNEEQQKHDLMMKLEQTRQRQNLQRKLFEKKLNAQKQVQESPVVPLIALSKTPLMMKPKQESFKGLEASMKAGSNESAHLVKNMSQRGLNLTFLQKK